MVNTALISVAASELVTRGDLAALSDVNAHQVVNTGGQFILIALEFTHTDDSSAFTVRDLKRCIANLASLLTEDGAQQTFFRRELGFTLGRDLADQNVASFNLGADADAAPRVEISRNLLRHIGTAPGHLF